MISFPEENTGDSLWEQYEKDHSNEDLRNQLVEQNLGLVHLHAKKLLNKKQLFSLEHDDLVCMGAFGLIDAVENYDPQQGTRFSTFAYPRIRGAMLDGLREEDPCKRNVRTRLKEIEKDSAVFAHQERHFPNEQELVDLLRCTQEELNAMQLDKCGQLRERENRKNRTQGYVLPDSKAENPSKRLESTIPSHLLKDLNTRERITILLQHCEGYNKREVARSIGFDPALVTRLDQSALRKMRKTIEKDFKNDLYSPRVKKPLSRSDVFPSGSKRDDTQAR